MDEYFIKKYILKSQELGAGDCRTINPNTVVTAPWVRLKCRYGCGFYDTNRSCPPYTPTDGEMRSILDSYGLAFLIRFRGYENVNPAIRALEKELLADGFYKSICFGAGPCRECRICNTGRCNFPSVPRPSLAGCGVDVLATVANNGFPSKLSCNPSEADCYALILVE